MKSKIIIASILFTLGLVAVADWIIFSINKEYENLSWEVFKTKYLEHLPGVLQPIYQTPLISTLILLACFTVAGILFMRIKQRLYSVLGILSFVLAFWQLFTLM